MRVPRRVAAGCNLGAWDQTSVRNALREKGTTEVLRGLYLLHVPVRFTGSAEHSGVPASERPDVGAGKTQCPGTPAVPGLKRNSWYGALARMCAVVRNMTCWSELQVT